ncbi:MAG TPA: SDR family NAD(P)-dependent oxidoreductase, partial [Cyclobacteriaceae bacterium]|nr:SDR family NAD(P)-dependent oxidoreductase [Cyclobacteriaceae bacterium]
SIFTNSVSPAVFVNLILSIAGDKKLVFVNISSGAANRPIVGWAAYCASKAYAKAFFEVLNEQEKENPKIKVLQIDPGMMDTEMQKKIRMSDPKILDQHSKFVTAKKEGNLKTPEQAAEYILSQIALS